MGIPPGEPDTLETTARRCKPGDAATGVVRHHGAGSPAASSSFVAGAGGRYRPPSVPTRCFTGMLGLLPRVAALLCLVVGHGVLAQTPGPTARPSGQPRAPAPPPPPAQDLDQFEGRLIREVRLLSTVPGTPDRSEPVAGALAQLMRNQIRTEAGTPFRAQTVRDDLTRLNRLGRFKTIKTAVQLQTDGSVVVAFDVAEQPVVQDVQVIGNRELSDQDLLKEVTVLAGSPIDRFQIDRSARAIEDLYLRKGYYRVRVTVDEKELSESSIVLFRVIEGYRVKVTDIRFSGNNAFSAKELRSAIQTTEYIPIIEKGPLDDDVLIADKASLVRFYRDRGFLDARADTRVQPSPDGTEATVTYLIEEGPLYTLRSVRVLYTTADAVAQYKREILKDDRADLSYLTPDQMLQIGRRPLTDAQISGLLIIKPGDVYSEDKLRKSQEAITQAYGKLGYLLDSGRGPMTVFINPQEVRDEKQPLVDLLLFLQEGKQYKTGQIIITGNDLTKQEVILRQLQVKPERPLDDSALRDSQKRIAGLRLFEPTSVRLSVQPEDEENNPGYRDVLVEVAETNTGEFNFGAAIGSDNGVVGRLAVVQRNFDVADVPDSWSELISGRSFRGAGQTFDIEILPGTEVSTYSVRLTDPYFLETNYSATGTAFYRLREYDQYNENEYGGAVGFGRRFGTVWTGGLTFSLNDVTLRDIATDAPVDVYEAQGPSLLFGISFELSRNTTDDPYRPSRGSRTAFAVEQVYGDYTYNKLGYQYVTFFNLYESFLGYKTILKLRNDVVYFPQGQDAVPTYNRAYLGGQNFRGFDYRTVSPKGIQANTGTVGDEPVGGIWSFFAGAEINQPIYKDIFSVVAFVDSGTVDTDVSFDKYRLSVGVGLRFYIQALSPIPLALDFGFPLMKQPGDESRLFTFSIDLPYN